MGPAENELIALERKYWQAMKDKDADAAMALTDEPCIVASNQTITIDVVRIIDITARMWLGNRDCEDLRIAGIVATVRCAAVVVQYDGYIRYTVGVGLGSVSQRTRVHIDCGLKAKILGMVRGYLEGS